MRFGVPYQGSKNRIARRIVEVLPSGGRFVDLFAGGCAMTHAAMVSGKYGTFLANDLQGDGVRLFRDAIDGKCNGRWREWIGRADFMARKGIDPLAALCWSFSCNGREYLYGADREAAKRAAHFEYVEGCAAKPSQELEHIERARGLEQLRKLAPLLERLQTSRLDWRKVELLPGDVVYCDIPYKGTQRYNAPPFPHGDFWAWANAQQFAVFVSEYNAPAGFTAIWETGKRQLMKGRGTGAWVAERVFVADRYAPEYQTELPLDWHTAMCGGY